MPQMAPLWRESLFLMFIVMFMIVNTIMYFNMNMQTQKKYTTKKIKIDQLKWKW